MDQRIIRKPELFSRIGLSDATIWRMEKSGKFPRRIQLGGKSVGWFDSEVEAWLSKKSSDRSESRAPAGV
jgi:prophage regulatory protein